jgi:hypothetical protein
VSLGDRAFYSYDRAGRGWLGHRAYVVMVLAYAVGPALMVVVSAYTHHWASVPVRALLLALFWLYAMVTVLATGLFRAHSYTHCKDCAADRVRFSESQRHWRLVGWRFRRYHMIKDYGTWLLFQIAAAVELTFVEHGFTWAWPGVALLALWLVVVYAAAGFHTRYGSQCPVCRPPSSPARLESFFNPNRPGGQR